MEISVMLLHVQETCIPLDPLGVHLAAHMASHMRSIPSSRRLSVIGKLPVSCQRGIRTLQVSFLSLEIQYLPTIV